MTKTDLLDWVNKTLDTDYLKIEKLGDCVGYMQLLHIYFPNKVNMNKLQFLKINLNARKNNAKILEKTLQKILPNFD